MVLEFDNNAQPIAMLRSGTSCKDAVEEKVEPNP